MQSHVNWLNHEVSTKTPLGQHLLSHERPANYNPEAPENQYPRMLYKAHKREDGKVLCFDMEPRSFLYPSLESYRMACEAVQNWNLTCQRTVGLDGDFAKGQREEEQAFADGWRRSQQEAIDVVMKWQTEMATAYAERAFSERKLSDKAKAEAQAHDDATTDHVPVIPEARTQKAPKEHWKTRQAREAREAAASA